MSETTNQLAPPKWLLGRPRLTYRQVMNTWGVVFIVPIVLFFVVFKFVPMGAAIVLSLFRYDLLSPPQFAGVDNYAKLATDPLFRNSLAASAYYVVGVTIPVWLLSLGMAVVFNQQLPAKSFLRLVYFLPIIMSQIVVAIIWKFMYQPAGLVNSLLAILDITRVDWLTNTDTAMPALILIGIWRATPYFMIIYLAGLQAIPHDYYQAASLDGASRVQQFRYITMPLLKPTFALVVIISILMAVKVFINPLVMTGGGPSDATRVLPLLIYQTGFQFFKMGFATAMATVLFLIVMVFTLIQLRLFRSQT